MRFPEPERKHLGGCGPHLSLGIKNVNNHDAVQVTQVTQVTENWGPLTRHISVTDTIETLVLLVITSSL